MAVKALERVFTAIVLVSRHVKATSRLSCLFRVDSSLRLNSYPAGPQTPLRDSIAILLVSRLFLETLQLSCWSPDSTWGLRHSAGPQIRHRDYTAILMFLRLVLKTSLLSCWYTYSSKRLPSHPVCPKTFPRYFTAILLVPRLFLETSQLICRSQTFS